MQSEEEFWKSEVIEETRYTQVRFLKKCSVFVEVNEKEVWMIYCPECATTIEDSKFIQGFSGLRNHLLSWHPETSKFVAKMNNKAVIYMRDNCRLYRGQIHLDRLEALCNNPDIINRFFMKPVLSRLRDEIKQRSALVNDLIDGRPETSAADPHGTFNHDLDEIRYVERNLRFTSVPEEAEVFARLEVFPTVVKLSSTTWAALTCKLCGGNCNNRGHYLTGIDGFRHHVRMAHAQDAQLDLQKISQRDLFAVHYCSVVEVDPKTLHDVPKVPCVTIKSRKNQRKGQDIFPGLKKKSLQDLN
jgi:hypothetical protein